MLSIGDLGQTLRLEDDLEGQVEGRIVFSQEMHVKNVNECKQKCIIELAVEVAAIPR